MSCLFIIRSSLLGFSLENFILISTSETLLANELTLKVFFVSSLRGSHNNLSALKTKTNINHRTASKLLNWNRVCIFIARQTKRKLSVLSELISPEIRFDKVEFKLLFILMRMERKATQQTE